MNEKANSIIEGFTITNGYTDRGGAIRCYKSSPTIRSCNITGNTAEYGGAIDCNQSNPTIVGCNISANSADNGGGIYCYKANPTIIQCALTSNRAGVDGGVICGFYERPHSTVTIINSTIKGNSAGYYGGVLADCDCSIINSVISGNSAVKGGVVSHGRGMIRNCTIVGNSGDILLSLVHPSNCIIWDNRPVESGRQSWDYNCLQGGGVGLGCISSDPCFVVPGYWDANGTVADHNDDSWVEGNYRLLPDSLCIDAGDNTALPPDSIDLDGDGNTVEPTPLDLDGWTRIADGNCDDTNIVDMGAYEFYFPLSWNCRSQCHGDADCDGSVKGPDFLALKDAWHTSYGDPNYNPCADFDRNGRVGASDLLILRQRWYKTVPDDCKCCGDQPGDLDRNEIVDIVDFTLFAQDWFAETAWHK